MPAGLNMLKSGASLELDTPARSPLKTIKKLRRYAIETGDKEEVAGQSPRRLIQILCIFSEEVIREASPNSALLRKTVRVPLVMILIGAGLAGGYFNVLVKCTGELLTGDIQQGDIWLAIQLYITGLLFTVFQLWLLNVSMKFYDLLDVIPIFMTSILIFNILEGLIILDEYSAYENGSDLVGITVGIVLCLLGITLLMLKNHDQVKTKAMTKDESDSDASSEMHEMRNLLLKFLANDGEKTIK